MDLCHQLKDDKALNPVLELLMTPDEKENIAMRCLIIRALLQKKLTQREIAKSLHVSIAKITRGSNEIKRLNPTLIQSIRKYLAIESD